MSQDKRWQFELEEYIHQGEPAQAQKSEAWQTAIGLQYTVNFLRVYLILQEKLGIIISLKKSGY